MEIIELDCRGLSCPEPLTILRNTVRKAEPGQEIHILSDDPVSLRDIPAFCKFMGHTLQAMPCNDNHLFIVLKKS